MARKLLDAEQALSIANKTVDGTPNGELLPDSPSNQVVNDPIRLLNL
jgi:hypothetical protein